MDGWIEWFGESGTPPDTHGKPFRIRFRDGFELALNRTKPYKLDWKHTGSSADIVAYKLTKGGHILSNTDKPADVEDLLLERGVKYGKFVRHARISQELKSTFFSYKNPIYYDHDQVEALEMIFHKLARIANGDHKYYDSWKDIAGYAKLVSDRLEKGEEK